MSNKYLQTTSGSISWTTAANWSPLVAPTTSDDVKLENSVATVDSGYLNTATLASLTVSLSFTGSAGLTAQTTKSVSGITRSSSTATATSTGHGYANGDVVTVSGAAQTDYNITATISNVTANTFDYTVANTPVTPATGTIVVVRDDYLIQPATVATFGLSPANGASANGCPLWKHNFGTVQATVTVLGTASAGSESGYEPLRLLGSHASNTLYMVGGICGLATTNFVETATFATINQTDGTLNGGPGLTWSTIYQSNGTMTLNSGATSGTLTQSGGTLTLKGTGKVATVTCGGTMRFDMRAASGTSIGTLTLDDGCTFDLSNNPANISVTTIVADGDVTIKRNQANPGHFSWTTLTQNPGSTITFK